MKRNLNLMLLIVFLQGFVLYGPIATLYRQSRGISVSDIFITEVVFSATMLLFEVPWGYIADRIGYRRVLIISNILFLLSKIIFLFAYGLPAFIFERIVVGMALAGISGCDTALIYESLEGEDSQKFFGKYYAISNYGFFLASIAGSYFASISFALPVQITIAFYFAASIASFFLIEPHVHKKLEKQSSLADIKHALSQISSNKAILAISLFNGVLMLVSQALIFLNQLQFKKTGIDIIYFGLIIAFIQLTAALSAKTHAFTKRFGEYLFSVAMPIGIGLAYIVLSVTQNPVISILMMAVITSFFAMLQPLIYDLMNKSITSYRATMLSICSWIGSLVTMLLNPVVGFLSDISLETVFIFLGASSLAAGFGFLMINKKV